MGSFLPGPPREELEAVTSRHFTVNHGQKRFNAWTYEKIPATRTAIDAIIQDLQDRVRTAQEKPARQEKSVNFQNSDMLLAAVFLPGTHRNNLVTT